MRVMVITLLGATACVAESQPSPQPIPPPKPELRARVSAADSANTSLTPDVVLAKIQAHYTPGIIHCFPEHGRADISLQVTDTGHATGTPRGLEAAADACLALQVDSWRFPIPKNDEGEAVAAGFVVTLQIE